MTTGMTFTGWTMILIFVALIIAAAKPAGIWMHRLYSSAPMPVERP